MTHLVASCSCGQLRATVTHTPVRVSVCHCRACQRRTGSAFGVQARFERGSVHIQGQGTEFVRTGDSGRRITFTFCPHCGSTLHYTLEGLEDFVGIPVGAFADRSFIPPSTVLYEEHAHPWVELQLPAASS